MRSEPHNPIHPTRRFIWLVLTATGCVLITLGAAIGQPIVTAPRPTSPDQPDPLSAFMVPQPPIDTTSPIVPIVTFEPIVIAAGESAVYRVVINAMEQSINWPALLPAADGLTAEEGASAQFLQSVGGSILPRTTFLYHVTAASPGTYVLPAYDVEVRGEPVRIPAATLSVVPPGSPAGEPATRVLLRTRGTEFFVGQDIELEVTLPGKLNGTVRTLSQVEVVGDGMIVDRNFRQQRVETRVLDETSRPVFVYEALMTPIRPGTLTITAHGHTVTSRGPASIVTPGGAVVRQGSLPTYTLVDSDPLTLNILPIPPQPDGGGFTGAIGNFSIDPPRLSSDQFSVGELVTLSLTIRGRGNLQRVLPPRVEEDSHWQVIAPRKSAELAAVIRQRGSVTFDYHLIPLTDSVTSTPTIPFLYFDPLERRYVDLTVESIQVSVESSPSEAIADGPLSLPEARQFLRESAEGLQMPTALADTLEHSGRAVRGMRPMHREAGFLLIQCLPALLMGGLVFWDRRRRYYEDHPEKLIRRRARRAVAREAGQARKAARRADAQRFLLHAIRGLREACAPAGSAVPQSMVREDILHALPPSSRGEDTVRVVDSLFAAANQWRFADKAPEYTALLALAAEVDRELELMRDAL